MLGVVVFVIPFFMALPKLGNSLWVEKPASVVIIVFSDTHNYFLNDIPIRIARNSLSGCKFTENIQRVWKCTFNVYFSIWLTFIETDKMQCFSIQV